MFTRFTLTTLMLGLSILGYAQISITGITSDFSGYWQSTTNNISTVQPNNLHNLTAFKVGNNWYSTGVDDNRLTGEAVSFVPAVFNSLDITTVLSNVIGQAALADGNINSCTPIHTCVPVGSSHNVSPYLTDGIQGLGLSTFVDNAGGTYSHTLSGIDPIFDGDGTPELIYFNIDAPANSQIQFQLYDANGVQIGITASSSQNSHPNIGFFRVDRYNVKNNSSTSINNTQSIQGFSIEFSDFAIPVGKHSSIVELRVILPNQTDPPFIAYNVNSFASAAILPVELVDFSAVQMDDHAIVSWETASEINNEYFDLQFSLDGKNWEDLAILEGQGTTSEKTYYEYVHRDIAQQDAKSIYYRLTQYDFDGKAFVSDIVTIEIEAAVDTRSISVFPNPVPQGSVITITGTTASNIYIYSLQGVLVDRQIADQGKYFDMDRLSTGLYIVYMETPAGMVQRKIYKQ